MLTSCRKESANPRSPEKLAITLHKGHLKIPKYISSLDTDAILSSFKIPRCMQKMTHIKLDNIIDEIAWHWSTVDVVYDHLLTAYKSHQQISNTDNTQ